jgi:hypothetical protein
MAYGDTVFGGRGPSTFLGIDNLDYLLGNIYDYGLLVFLLVFTIVFAVLQKTKILGEHKKNFNVMVSLVMGLSVVIPHITGDYPSNWDVVVIINNALPNVSLLAVAAIMLLILIGLFGGESEWMGGSLSGWMAILAFIFIVAIFGSAAGLWDLFIFDYFDDDTLATIVVILVFAIIVNYIIRDDTEADHMGKASHAFKEIGNLFGGGGKGGH